MSTASSKGSTPGAFGRLMDMDADFKNKQAPKVEIPGLRRSEPKPDPEKEKPATTADNDKPVVAEKKPSATSRSTNRDTSTKKADDKFLVRMIASEKIKPWKFANRPETEFGDWDDFVRSVAEKGVELPISVRPDAKNKGEFEVVAGRRRWRACLELGLEVPCFINDYSDEEAASLQQLENDKRNDLSPWANAVNWHRLINEGVFKSQSAMAVALGKDRRVISDYMCYVNLPEKLSKAIGPMTNVGIKMAKLLSRLCSDPQSGEQNVDNLVAIADKIREGKISVSKVQDVCRTGSTNRKPDRVKVNGVEMFTVRRDSNGTKTISILKAAEEVVSIDDITKMLTDYLSDRMK